MVNSKMTSSTEDGKHRFDIAIYGAALNIRNSEIRGIKIFIVAGVSAEIVNTEISGGDYGIYLYDLYNADGEVVQNCQIKDVKEY